MSVTETATTVEPPRPTGGVDWAKDDHAVAVVAPDGEQTSRFSVSHDAAGLRTLIVGCWPPGSARSGSSARMNRSSMPCARPDRSSMTSYAGSSRTCAAATGRRGTRTTGSTPTSWPMWCAPTGVGCGRCWSTPRPPRPCVSSPEPARTSSGTGVAVANQLRAHLQIVLPAAVGLFADIDSDITLRFLDRFGHQSQADWLTPRRLAAWLAAVGYCGRVDPAVLHARLTAAPRGSTGPDAATSAAVTTTFVAVLRTLTTQIEALAARISEQLDLHPDAAIFTSLPRSGRVRAARLLAEIGDARGRFPTADSLACLAGVAPSTRQSGKVTAVSYRWGADKQLRDAVCDFAGDSRHANPWAADLYRRARARGHDHPHAVRILARAWVNIIWACWSTYAPYDPDRHGALQRVLNQDQPAAA